MDLASMISFGILILAWMVLPIREPAVDSGAVSLEELRPSHQVD